jgi:hypothetical protein
MFFSSPKEEIDRRLQTGVLKDTKTGLTDLKQTDLKIKDTSLT